VGNRRRFRLVPEPKEKCLKMTLREAYIGGKSSQIESEKKKKRGGREGGKKRF